MKSKKQFYILDWSGRILFDHEKFPSFDDAWARIYDHLSEKNLSDEEYDAECGEYQVLPCNEVKTI